MEASDRWNVVIIGGGIAGLSTAIWARRLGLSALVLERAEEAGGQLRSIQTPIVDYPGLAAESGATLSQRLRDQAAAAGAVLRPTTHVLAVDSASRICHTDAGLIAGDAVVLATGLSPRRLGVPGESDLAALGLVHRPSTEPEWFREKRVAVVGGGDRAAENALLLAGVAARVYLLHRGDRLRARPEFQEQLAANGRVEIRLHSEVAAIRAAPGAAISVDLGPSGVLDVDALCIYIGNRPNTDLLMGQAELTSDGYLAIDRNGQSSAPGVYGVGDVCTPAEYQSLATAAGQAMIVAKHIALSRQNA